MKKNKRIKDYSTPYGDQPHDHTIKNDAPELTGSTYTYYIYNKIYTDIQLHNTTHTNYQSDDTIKSHNNPTASLQGYNTSWCSHTYVGNITLCLPLSVSTHHPTAAPLSNCEELLVCGAGKVIITPNNIVTPATLVHSTY